MYRGNNLNDSLRKAIEKMSIAENILITNLNYLIFFII